MGGLTPHAAIAATLSSALHIIALKQPSILLFADYAYYQTRRAERAKHAERAELTAATIEQIGDAARLATIS